MRRSSAVTAVFGLALVIQACSPSAASPAASTGASTGAGDAGCLRRSAVGRSAPRPRRPWSSRCSSIRSRAWMPWPRSSRCARLPRRAGNERQGQPDRRCRRGRAVPPERDDPLPGRQPAGHHVLSRVPGSPGFATAGYLLDITDRLARLGGLGRRTSTRSSASARVQADGKYLLDAAPRHGHRVLHPEGRPRGQRHLDRSARPRGTSSSSGRRRCTQATGLPAITIPAGTTWGGGTFDEGFIHVFLGTGGTLFDAETGKWVVKSQALNDAFDFYARSRRRTLLPSQALLDPQPWQPTKYDGFTGTTADGKAIPVAPPITTQGSWGWVYDWGPADRRPAHPRHHRQGDQLGVPEQGPGRHLRVGAEDWMWTISAKSQASRRGVRASCSA